MPETDKREELERIKAASARLVHRAQRDPEVARAFLRDIGYYEMMAQDASGNGAAPTPQTIVRKTSGRKASARKSVPATRKAAAAKR